VDNWRQAIIAFTDAPAFAGYRREAEWTRVQASGATVRGWSDAYGHLLVATGRAEVMLDAIMSPWDCGPFPVILHEAGGYFGDWQGNSTIYSQEGLSCNAALREKALALVARPGGHQP
jgi:myo-inositol-1(or 4)-monophosphatase